MPKIRVIRYMSSLKIQGILKYRGLKLQGPLYSVLSMGASGVCQPLVFVCSKQFRRPKLNIMSPKQVVTIMSLF